MTPNEIEMCRKQRQRNVDEALREREEQKFREYIEKPTLIEALRDALERLATLETRVDRIEIHQRTQQMLAYDDNRTPEPPIYYGEPELDDTIDESDEVI